MSRWLRGEAIPAHDTLLVLADILKVEPEVLRYGEAVRKAVQQKQKRWDEGTGYVERETCDAFLKLPAPQRKLIREVILTFAKVHEAPRGSSGDSQGQWQFATKLIAISDRALCCSSLFVACLGQQVVRDVA